jgi:hypothetical protein
MYDPVAVLARNRALERGFSGAEKHVYQFVEVRPRDELLHFSVYATRVTVYIVSSVATGESAGVDGERC